MVARRRDVLVVDGRLAVRVHPRGVGVVRADIDHGGEGHDRDLRVAGHIGHVQHLRGEAVGRGPQGGDAAAGHGAGIVEHKRDLEQIAPELGRRLGADGDRRDSDHRQQIGLVRQRGGRVHLAGRGVDGNGHRDLRGEAELAADVLLDDRSDLGIGGERRHRPRCVQRGGIQGALQAHLPARCHGVVDRAAGDREKGHQRNGEEEGNTTGDVRTEAACEARPSVRDSALLGRSAWRFNRHDEGPNTAIVPSPLFGLCR